MIPVRNEARHIYNTLDQLRRQSMPTSRFEVLVVDGDSEDATRDEIARFARDHPGLPLRLLRNSSRLSSAARNLAVRAGTGRYVLLIDGHVHIPRGDLLSVCIERALSTGARVLGRPQPLNPPDATSFQLDVARARASPLAHSTESFIYARGEAWVSPISVAVLYDRSLFDEVGLFDERFDAAEDLEFNYRLEAAGHRCLFSSDFSVSYYPRTSLGLLFQQLRRYGAGRAKFALKHPLRFRVEIAVPSLLLLFLLVLAALSAWSSTALAITMLVLVGGCALLIAEGLRLRLRHRAGSPLRMACIIATVHMGVGVGFIEGLFRGLGKP
jgi:succinoglycan biosynthesis protein ExoA